MVIPSEQGNSTKPKAQRQKRNRKPKKKVVEIKKEENGLVRNAVRKNKVPAHYALRSPQLKALEPYWALTSKEKKFAQEWLLNMLDPKKAFKMPRPFPALSYADFQTGEIFFDTEALYMQITTKPDPFELVLIKKLGASTSVVISEDLVEDFRVLNSKSPNATILSGTHTFGLQMPLPLTNGHFLEPVRSFIKTPPNPVYGFVNGQVEEGSLFGYKGLTVPTADISCVCTNRSSASVSARVQWIIFDESENIVSVNSGLQVLVTAGGINNCILSQVGLPMATTDQFTCIAIAIDPNPNHAPINDFSIGLRTLTGVNVVEPVSTESWTLGQAVYGKQTPDSVILDEIVSGCELWSPVAMSTKCNIDQQLNAAGGRYQSSYLPSFIQAKMPDVIETAWTFIDGRKRSYPVAETPFVVGSQASWVGQRILDYEFRQPFKQSFTQAWQREALPETIIIASKVSAEATVKYRLDFAIVYEMQTTHPAYVMTTGPCSAEFQGLMCAYAASHALLVGENPSHVTRLKKLAKQLTDNPDVQRVFKGLLAAGLAAL